MDIGFLHVFFINLFFNGGYEYSFKGGMILAVMMWSSK